MKAASANLLSIIIQISNRQHALGESQRHFLGSVAYFQKSIHTVFDVPRLLAIDGQQFLTTFTLLTTTFTQSNTKNREVA